MYFIEEFSLLIGFQYCSRFNYPYTFRNVTCVIIATYIYFGVSSFTSFYVYQDHILQKSYHSSFCTRFRNHGDR